MAAELKTKQTRASVREFLDSIADDRTREDCQIIARLMSRVTGAQPRMWGPSIVGFGSYHYRYASGRQGDWMVTGFSPRKQNLTLYFMTGFTPRATQMARLGTYTTGKSCLYIKTLKDIDLETLEEILRESVAATQATSVESEPEPRPKTASPSTARRSRKAAGAGSAKREVRTRR